MFKRKIYNELKKWKDTWNGKYACIIEGARRIGKSTIVEEFAKNEYQSYIKIDFSIITNEILDIFKDIANHDLFFSKLELATGITLYERKSCIIFDEVQLYPKARQAIKHLVADGRFDYIETGSLISIKKNVKDILIPSEEHKINMYPMDYEEFCWAINKNYDLFKNICTTNSSIDEGTNRMLMRDFRLYLAIGGMPQAVDAYINKCSFVQIDEIKREIINLYIDDLNKIDPTGYTSKIFESIPSELALKRNHFTISKVLNKRTTMRDKERLSELIDSRIVIPCYNVLNPSISLTQSKDLDCFKLYLCDVGLFVTMLFNTNNQTDENIYLQLLSDKLGIDKGYLYENVVAQALYSRNIKPYYYTWNKENSTHKFEIDFLVQNGKKIIPIEVKSGKILHHESIDAFSKKYSSLIQNKYLLSQKPKTSDGDLLKRPIYMTEMILDQIINK